VQQIISWSTVNEFYDLHSQHIIPFAGNLQAHHCIGVNYPNTDITFTRWPQRYKVKSAKTSIAEQSSHWSVHTLFTMHLNLEVGRVGNFAGYRIRVFGSYCPSGSG